MGSIDDTAFDKDDHAEKNGIILKMSADSDEGSAFSADDTAKMESSDSAGNGSPTYHQTNPEPISEEAKQKERDFRKKLNQTARAIVSDSIHQKVKLIVHRPEYDSENQQHYVRLSNGLIPIVREIARGTLPLLEHETSSEFARNHYYGSKFQADSVAYKDYRYFSKKRPPTDSPPLLLDYGLTNQPPCPLLGDWKQLSEQ